MAVLGSAELALSRLGLAVSMAATAIASVVAAHEVLRRESPIAALARNRFLA